MSEPCMHMEGPCRATLELMPEGTQVLLYAWFLISLAFFAAGFGVRIARYMRARPEVAWDHPWQRAENLVRIGLLQAKTMRKRYAGPMHQMIYWGFVVLFIGTILVLIDYDITLPLFQMQFLVGRFYLVFEFALDLFGAIFLIGLFLAIRRRLSPKKEEALYNKPQDLWMLGSLTLLGIQGFLVEALRLTLTQPPWAPYSFVGNALSYAFQPLAPSTQLGLYQGLWWFHAMTLFAWIATLPYTKMRHALTAPANVFFQTQGVVQPKGELPTPFDLQKALETGNLDIRMGAQKLEDYTWRQLLSLDACTECGRCQEVCPAYAAGRPLSPMKVVLDLRDEMTRQASSAWSPAPGPARAWGEAGTDFSDAPTSTAPLAGNALVESVIREQTLWSCVTCRACMEACPVMIEHVPLIVEMRRGLVMESRLDDQQTRLLNNLANSGNAYGFPASDRDAWTEGLDVPKLADVPDPESFEVLYWVGCSGSYDGRNQKVSRSLVKILKAANVRFAILGKEERCTGDPARRLGEESRFQELVITNAATLQKYKVRKVIAQCPHCFNTLKNEYKRFGVELDVEHHTQFVKRLMDEGRLTLTKSIPGDTTYHDPCYLGRYNDEYEAPRQVLIQLQKNPLKEMPRSHNHSFCCGAGGANMWFEVKEEKRRMSHIRIQEAQDTGAKRMATACPFCMTMFDDAARVLSDGAFEVKDFAELVADALDGPA